MLANLLPGLRHFRTPFAVGALLAFQIWLIFGNSLPARGQAHGILHRMYSLGETAGRPIVTAVIAFLLYLIGDIAKLTSDQFAKITKQLHKKFDLLSYESGLRLVLFAITAYPIVANAIPTEEVNDLARKMRTEFPALRVRLIASHGDIYLEQDRLNSEAEFRLNVALFSISSWFVLAAAWSPWFLFGLVASGILYRNGLRALREANSLIVEAVVGRLITSDFYEGAAQHAQGGDRSVRAQGSDDVAR
ncbi:hypothetical protein ABZ357_10825 [Streptomyces sp. NPDC005917]|uniref:hypothetical protein n=1 Tax=unclassified Streptomyces TaxID=2593676 RepID=UPI0033F184F0